jgi:hypothetical protein
MGAPAAFTSAARTPEVPTSMPIAATVIGRKRFFLKKEAKTFAPGAAQAWRKIRDELKSVAKVFWFFFSKKNASLCFRQSPHTPPQTARAAGIS